MMKYCNIFQDLNIMSIVVPAGASADSLPFNATGMYPFNIEFSAKRYVFVSLFLKRLRDGPKKGGKKGKDVDMDVNIYPNFITFFRTMSTLTSLVRKRMDLFNILSKNRKFSFLLQHSEYYLLLLLL